MSELPEPSKYVVMLCNSQMKVVTLGTQNGEPFASETAATEFLERYLDRYPSLDGIVLPIIPNELDV